MFKAVEPWWKLLNDKVAANKQNTEALFKDETIPMSYYRVYKVIKDLMPDDYIFVGEGANTMVSAFSMIFWQECLSSFHLSHSHLHSHTTLSPPH